jgi:hypothetical protein
VNPKGLQALMGPFGPLGSEEPAGPGSSVGVWTWKRNQILGNATSGGCRSMLVTGPSAMAATMVGQNRAAVWLAWSKESSHGPGWRWNIWWAAIPADAVAAVFADDEELANLTSSLVELAGHGEAGQVAVDGYESDRVQQPGALQPNNSSQNPRRPKQLTPT